MLPISDSIRKGALKSCPRLARGLLPVWMCLRVPSSQGCRDSLQWAAQEAVPHCTELFKASSFSKTFVASFAEKTG